MGHTLSYTVTTFDGARYRELADFARLDPAIRAAKIALDDKRVTLAVVKDRDGTLIYAADRRKEWAG